jgi:DNA replication protein DnaC
MFNLPDVKIRRRTWIQLANIPSTRLGWTLDDCVDAPAGSLEDISAWVTGVKNRTVIRNTRDSNCGKGLMFWGTPGLGKTTLALAIIQELMLTLSLEQFDVKENNVLVRPCYFSTFNDILNLKGLMMDGPTDEEERLYKGMLGECTNDAYNIRVLIIDDIGKEHAGLTGWQKNMLHHVLRTRFNAGLPTIITTNIERKNWAGLYGDATESFVNEAFLYVPIETTKGDLRK